MSTADVQKSLPAAELAKLGATIKTYGAVEKIGDAAVDQVRPEQHRDLPGEIRQSEHQFPHHRQFLGAGAGFFQLPGRSQLAAAGV